MPKCNILHNHASLNINGHWQPCCVFDSRHRGPTIGNLREYRSSTHFQNIVNTMYQEDQWHPGCQRCKDDENVGKIGFRDKANHTLSGIPDRIEYVELSVSNQCNLSCKMCGPWSSSKWAEIVDKEPMIQKWHQPTQHRPAMSISEIFNGIDTSHVTRIKYLGGEPFITKELGELFSFLDEKHLVEKIEFECNTNGTLFPRKHVDFLNRFSSIDIKISIDGIGPLANYIRTGFDWDRVLEVLLQWSEYSKWRMNNIGNSNISFYTVIQAYNIHQISEIMRFGQSLGFQTHGAFIVKPEHLSLNALPEDYLLGITSKLENDQTTPSYITKKLKQLVHDRDLFNRLKEYTLAADQSMQTSIADTIPELFSFFK